MHCLLFTFSAPATPFNIDFVPYPTNCLAEGMEGTFCPCGEALYMEHRLYFAEPVSIIGEDIVTTIYTGLN